MSPLAPKVIPSCEEQVLAYCQKLWALCETKGISHMREYRIERVKAFKQKTASQHEYLSAAVTVTSTSETAYVAIERLKGDRRSISQPLGIFTSISSASISSDSISDTCVVKDQIAPLTSWTHDKNDELICDLIFEKPFHLYELAILAWVVHETNTSYLLLSNNCYHYAGTIIKVLQEGYDTKDTAEGADAGKWCRFVINSRKEDISVLLEKLRQEIKSFVSFVRMLNNLPLLTRV
jgi:hypothetical protein